MLISLGRGTYTSVFSIPSNGFECFCVKALYCQPAFKKQLSKRCTVAQLTRRATAQIKEHM